MLRTIPRYNPTDGTFEIRDVPSGLFYLNVSLRDANPAGAGASRPVPVTVSWSDVEGVVVTVEPYVSIPGTVSIEGQSSAGLNRTRVMLNLSAAGRRLVDSSYGAIGGVPVPNVDGTFVLRTSSEKGLSKIVYFRSAITELMTPAISLPSSTVALLIVICIG